MSPLDQDIEIAYQETLDFLYSFIDYSLTRSFRYTADKFDLKRMVDFLELLENPHQNYPIIHITGTKGKGSTAALTASALQAAGYKVGFYTSPHLVDYCERIQVNNVLMTHAEMVALVDELKPLIKEVESLTTFEITTALAFLHFARTECDVAVVEVGLGGRLDATNVVDPLVSVITSISYDHTNVLGNTLEAIATEKAGIIKYKRPVVMAPQAEGPKKTIIRIAAERQSPLKQVGEDYLYAPRAHSLDGQTLMVWSAEEQSLVNEFIQSGGRSDWEPLRLTIPLLGHHQVVNAATAYAALQVARENGLPISDACIQQGFADVFWPCRFEVLQRNPLIIIDSAHNRDSALKLRLSIDDYLPDIPVILIFGASEDKDVSGMFTELLPRVRRVIATQSVHPRALEAEELVKMAYQFGCPAEAVVPVMAALERALYLAGKDSAIVVAGSLFAASAVRETWVKRRLGLRQND